jgi:hypothetical protein
MLIPAHHSLLLLLPGVCTSWLRLLSSRQPPLHADFMLLLLLLLLLPGVCTSWLPTMTQCATPAGSCASSRC